ncbi:hypothetical protein ACFXKD_00400 [Nocardiopsis aegyptia]|uniref:hypothetical protein n=1 Tax=Nocardiopsis aegyptia TaxID=220378 RepID=UPI00366C1937
MRTTHTPQGAELGIVFDRISDVDALEAGPILGHVADLRHAALKEVVELAAALKRTKTN